MTSAEAAVALAALLYRPSRRTFDAVEATPEDVRTLFFFAIFSPPLLRNRGRTGRGEERDT